MGSLLSDTGRVYDSPPLSATNQKPLTERQQQVYDFLIEFTLEHGYQPSMRELCSELGFASTNGAACHFVALHKKGWIRVADHQGRSLHIPEIIARLNGERKTESGERK